MNAEWSLVWIDFCWKLQSSLSGTQLPDIKAGLLASRWHRVTQWLLRMEKSCQVYKRTYNLYANPENRYKVEWQAKTTGQPWDEWKIAGSLGLSVHSPSKGGLLLREVFEKFSESVEALLWWHFLWFPASLAVGHLCSSKCLKNLFFNYPFLITPIIFYWVKCIFKTVNVLCKVYHFFMRVWFIFNTIIPDINPFCINK